MCVHIILSLNIPIHNILMTLLCIDQQSPSVDSMLGEFSLQLQQILSPHCLLPEDITIVSVFLISTFLPPRSSS